MRVRACLLAIVLVGCGRAGTKIEPAPETRPTKTEPAPTPPFSITNVRCTYGGTMPAFFVWFDFEPRVPMRKLRARSFEVESGGAFVDALESRLGNGVLSIRTRAPSDAGIGELGVVPEVIGAGDRLHLEVFGPLRTDVFGTGETYPTENRRFRATLEADGVAPFVIDGTCVVGPSG